VQPARRASPSTMVVMALQFLPPTLVTLLTVVSPLPVAMMVKMRLADPSRDPLKSDSARSGARGCADCARPRDKPPWVESHARLRRARHGTTGRVPGVGCVVPASIGVRSFGPTPRSRVPTSVHAVYQE